MCFEEPGNLPRYNSLAGVYCCSFTINCGNEERDRRLEVVNFPIAISYCVEGYFYLYGVPALVLGSVQPLNHARQRKKLVLQWVLFVWIVSAMMVTKVVGGCVYIRRRYYGILLRVGGEFEHSALSPLSLRSLSALSPLSLRSLSRSVL